MTAQRIMEESEKKPSFRDFAVEKKAWASDGYALELGDVKPLPGSERTPLNDEGSKETQSLLIEGKTGFNEGGEEDPTADILSGLSRKKSPMSGSYSSLEKADFKRSRTVASTLLDARLSTLFIPITLLLIAFLIVMPFIVDTTGATTDDVRTSQKRNIAAAVLFLFACIKYGKFGSKMSVIPNGAMVLSVKWGLFARKRAFTDHPNLIAVSRRENKRRFDVFVWADYEPFQLMINVPRRKIEKVHKKAQKKVDIDLKWVERDLNAAGFIRLARLFLIAAVPFALLCAVFAGLQTGHISDEDLSELGTMIIGESQPSAFQKFECDDGTRIFARQVDDGVEDCPDGSDEPDPPPWYIENVAYFVAAIILAPFITKSFLGMRDIAKDREEIFDACEGAMLS